MLELNTPSIIHCSLLRYKGDVDRDTCVTRDDLKQYGVRGRVMNKAFMSTTKDRTVAEAFAKRGVTDRQTGKGEYVKLSVLCTDELINERTGLDIEKLSEYAVEKGVLVGPYTAFVIRTIRSIRSQYVEMDLQECQNPTEDEEEC